ncbi:class I SAM-dependent methyltransferase [Kribbella antibiotica]|uniref:Class I SAM-dependent methyltransferase n=1 Tax=Kribbella antibiotica TaxID=190195 RepID=A0A4R4ZND8_9ACTN|nr:class I SAM-dependent methyltransferase [Kribbella antibiotica]TDD59464.1 class I SAM-dependent methyltransferase [Kribbella antibiotica]
MKPDHYDSFAAEYAAANETSLFNAYYNRPAVLALAGDVAGRTILDVGCGSGSLTEGLLAGGASVTGCEASPAMAAIARERLGEQVTIDSADLAQKLPYADAQFDDVIVSLVLHYFEDWTGPLAELRRILKPGGRLIVSVNHPVVYLFARPDGNYFSTDDWTDDYDWGSLTYWHRPLHVMTDSFTQAGFRISVISEPPFSPDTPKEILPPDLGDKKAFLCFLFFVLEAE